MPWEPGSVQPGPTVGTSATGLEDHLGIRHGEGLESIPVSAEHTGKGLVRSSAWPEGTRWCRGRM